MEIYSGLLLSATDIPEWHVSIKVPLVGGQKRVWTTVDYESIGEVPNSNVRYDSTDNSVHFEAGGTAQRTTPAGIIYLDGLP